MKTERLVFISCFAAAALIASPALSAPPSMRAQPRSMPIRNGHTVARAGTGTWSGDWSRHRVRNRFIFIDRFGFPFFYPYSYGYYYPYDYYGYDYGNQSIVLEVQRRLGELGYYHGVIDGIMGPETRAAISVYESTHNLVVDGAINAQLLTTLGLG